MNRLFAITACLVLTCFWACVDKIELGGSDRPGSGILVQGKFIPGTPGLVTAEVFELYVLSGNQPRPIGGAKVVLHDDLGHAIDLISNYDGKYYRAFDRNAPAFPVQPGRQYRLVASLPDGRVFESEWESLLDPAPADSLRAEIVVREFINADNVPVPIPTVQFYLDAGLKAPGSAVPARLRWEIDQSYKITDTPKNPDIAPKTCFSVRKLFKDNVLIIDGNSISQDRLQGYPLVETPVDYRFSEGFYLLVNQQTISANAYGYLEELNQLLARKGTQFDPPAGAIRSNITCPTHPETLVYGFFYVAQEDTARLYISPDFAGNPRTYCPLPVTFNPPSHPTPCDDCLLEAGGQLEQPYWWQE